MELIIILVLVSIGTISLWAISRFQKDRYWFGVGIPLYQKETKINFDPNLNEISIAFSLQGFRKGQFSNYPNVKEINHLELGFWIDKGERRYHSFPFTHGLLVYYPKTQSLKLRFYINILPLVALFFFLVPVLSRLPFVGYLDLIWISAIIVILTLGIKSETSQFQQDFSSIRKQIEKGQ